MVLHKGHSNLTTAVPNLPAVLLNGLLI
uniref:Uncharacterized protein n=1 Tax=Anguilla anguilla TaxID=7936 RepID=A0A0E9PI95_ANGAN